MVLNPSYWLPGVLIIQILYLDLFLDLFWTIFGLRSPKNVQNIFFKNVDFLLLFHSIVMRSFKVYNWCIGLFNHFYWLSGVFRNQILYLDLLLDLFLGQFWTQKAKKTGFFFKYWFSTAFAWYWNKNNWCIGLFNPSYWLFGVFKIQILYLVLFVGQFWTSFEPIWGSEGQKFCTFTLSHIYLNIFSKNSNTCIDHISHVKGC